jgi:hypothetical protein
LTRYKFPVQEKLIDHFSRFLPFVKINGGREGRPIGAYELAKAVEELGAGEILLNCIDCDGEDSYFSTLSHFFRKYSMTEFFFNLPKSDGIDLWLSMISRLSLKP